MTTLGAPTAEAIHAARIGAGLSQVELATKVGVRQSSVSQWERGVTRPSAGSLLALMRLLPGLAETVGNPGGPPPKTPEPRGLPGP